VHPYVVLDVFTDVPLQGNPLAVFPESAGLSDEVMQRTAREMNLSETVFLMPPDDGQQADARIRIFTPVTELPFAGHPTLGSAFVVGQPSGVSRVRLQTGAGVVSVALTRRDEDIAFGEMEQPIPAIEQFANDDELLGALGVPRSELPIEVYRNGPAFVYVGFPSEESLASLAPDAAKLNTLGELGFACFAGAGSHFKFRMFAPAFGVPEDPATGSAAGPLAVHLARHGWIEFGRQIEIRQGAEIGRPSLLYARVDGSADEIERVVVSGAAVLVARGEYRLS
jgi:trans-2,3-dihydro-3-hydroxyanthranilate isomerase